jgi:iron complex outermembrane receptor protein/hemoglobin/transferrin/lactoferrin receptor protein
VRIVNDGIPQESFEASPRWFAPGDVATADRIEVIRGPASILYGSSAIGGAINIIPRALPVTSAGDFRVDGLVETRYGSNNNERYGHAEVAGTTGSLGVVAGGSRRVAGNFHTPNATPYSVSRIQGAPAFVGEIAYTNYDQITTYGQLGVARRWGSARVLYDDWISSNNFPNANGKPTGVRAHNTNVRVQATLVSRAVIVKPSLSVQNVGIRRAATIAKTFEVASDSNLWDQNLRNRVVITRVEVEHAPVRGLRGTIGADYSHQNASTRRSQIQPSGTITNAAVFALEQFRIGDLTLTAGARGDTRNQRAASNTLVDSAPANERATLLERRFSVATGSIGGAYAFSESFTASANIGRGFRAPSFLDLYTNENRPALGGWVEGNPRANPEQSTTTEIGLHYAAARAELGVVGYRNQLSHFTYLSKTTRTRSVGTSSLPVFETRQARARITGLELNGRVSVLPTIALSADYSRILSRNIATRERLPLMPADQLRTAIRFAPASLRAIETPYVEIGAKHAWAKEIAGPTEPFADGGSKGFGVASTPAYSTGNAEIGGRVPFGACALEVHVSVDNIFGAAYRDYLDTQKGFTLAAGRNVAVRVAVPFVLSR